MGSPPTTGSALTTRWEPMIWLASIFASSCPSAFSTGAAAFFAAATLTGAPAGAIGSCTQTVTFLQSSVPGAYRLNVQLPGASLFTCRVGPEPSFPPPTRQVRPSATGVPSTPSAWASRATRSLPTSAPGAYTGAEPGPSGSSPAAT